MKHQSPPVATGGLFSCAHFPTVAHAVSRRPPASVAATRTTNGPGPAGSAEATAPVDRAEQFLTFTNTAMAYQTLARISGGLALTNTSNFDSAFQTLADDLNSYYSLGFKPSDTTAPGLRKIVVKMKNPEYRFRARRGHPL